MEETYLKETIKEGENGPQTTLLRYLHWLLRSKVWSYLNIALTLVHVVSVWKYNCIFYNRMWHTLHSTIAIFMMTYDSTNNIPLVHLISIFVKFLIYEWSLICCMFACLYCPLVWLSGYKHWLVCTWSSPFKTSLKHL